MKKKANKSLRQLKLKAWTLFSIYIRSTGADWKGFVRCYTCNKYDHWKSMHAGHYWHNKLDFDTRNIHKQCPYCNTYCHGKLDVYTLKLIEELGMDGLQKLRSDAHQHKGYSRLELLEIIKKYGR